MPHGWKVWRGVEVPGPIAQAAIDVRDHVRSYSRGQIAREIDYQGQHVGLWVSSHTWTYRNGVLVTGICIPGVSVLVPVPRGGMAVGAGTLQDDLSVPDPTAAVYGGAPPESTNWWLVGGTVVATMAVVAGFWAVLHFTDAKRLGR